MAIGYSRYLKTIYNIGDFLVLNLAFAGVSLYYRVPHTNADPNFLAQFLYINFFWVIATFITGIHKIDRGLRYEQILGQLLKAAALFCILMIAFLYFFEDYFIPVFNVKLKLLVFTAFFLSWRTLMVLFITYIRKRGLNYREVIIVGNGQPAYEMQKFFHNHPEVGYRLKGIFCDDSSIISKSDIIGTVAEAKEYAMNNRVDEIYCSLSGIEAEDVLSLMDFADRSLIRFKVVPDFRGFLHKKIRVEFYESVPVLSVRNEPLQNLGNRLVKRMFDMVFSLLVLLLVFPLALLIFAPLIKLSSKGPVFFKQMRSGKNNQGFVCWKFRTMKMNKEADSLQAKQGDQRITGIGKFLRKTSLDELPQFYNAFLGNMSVVGPRPHMLKHTEEYSQIIDKFMVRHFIQPGITGWAQVNGLRGETQDHSLMEKRVENDVWYIENWSLLLDLKIIVITVFQIVTGKHVGG
jgi:undecaprenyl-phosphate galactose phosphotransferase/putative colanic acid biosynthesis UDP-glucose lipid carrier transferase